MSTEATRILFTGAGFTHNFGTPLAKEMSDGLLSHRKVQSHSLLMELLRRTFDFEDVYQEVMDEDYDQGAKDAISEAIRQAYSEVDDIVRDCDARSGQTLEGVLQLIRRFARNRGDYFFTVNQDLFVERHYRDNQRQFIWPGIGGQQERWKGAPWKERLQLEDEHCTLPDEPALKIQKKSDLESGLPFYVKLHGSQNWYDSRGRLKLVIGSSKLAQIEEEPLLSWYFDLFKQAINRDNTCLCVIGYGFRHEHINSVLADAVGAHNLRIYVLSPKDREAFQCRLQKEPRGEDIIGGIAGYVGQSLVQALPPQDWDTPARYELWRSFFGVV